MKKSELKRALKPLIKECIREALFEEGVLSSVISEVVKGLGAPHQLVVENKQDDEDEIINLEQKEIRKQKINETRKKMLAAINKDAYGGVDIFENVSPLSRAGDPNSPLSPQGPLSGVSPVDSGVDISTFTGNKNVWKALVGGK